MSTWARVTSLVLVLQVVLAAGAQGAIITFQLNETFTGAVLPPGTTPWLTAMFDDGGSAGSVTLTLAATNLTGNEDVKEWYLNLDPALDPTELSFSSPSKTGVFDDPTVTLGADQFKAGGDGEFKAGGDGEFDILLAFADGNPDDRFTAGDSVQYTLTGIAGLTANSFDFLSTPSGGHGPFPTAAHVRSLSPGGSWVTVPEPASVGLLALGLGAVAALRRRARK